MSPDMKIIAIGCAGGVIPDLIRFAKARYETNIADYFKHWNFWLGLLVLVALGGIAVAPVSHRPPLKLSHLAIACDAGGRSKKVDRGVMTSSRPT